MAVFRQMPKGFPIPIHSTCQTTLFLRMFKVFFQFRAVVTDTFPADLYTTPQVDGTLTVSNDLTSLMGLTSGPILDQFIVSESAPSGTPLTVLVGNFVNGNNAAFKLPHLFV